MNSKATVDGAVAGGSGASFRRSSWPAFAAGGLLLTVWTVAMVTTHRHPHVMRASVPFATYVVGPLVALNVGALFLCWAGVKRLSAAMFLVALLPLALTITTLYVPCTL